MREDRPLATGLDVLVKKRHRPGHRRVEVHAEGVVASLVEVKLGGTAGGFHLRLEQYRGRHRDARVVQGVSGGGRRGY